MVTIYDVATSLPSMSQGIFVQLPCLRPKLGVRITHSMLVLRIH